MFKRNSIKKCLPASGSRKTGNMMKFQSANSKYQTSSNVQRSMVKTDGLVIGIWHSIFVWSLVIGIWNFTSAFAQSPTFIASVDKNQVTVGEQLEVTFTMSGSGGAKNFRAPAFKDFALLSGPNQSTNM